MSGDLATTEIETYREWIDLFFIEWIGIVVAIHGDFSDPKNQGNGEEINARMRRVAVEESNGGFNFCSAFYYHRLFAPRDLALKFWPISFLNLYYYYYYYYYYSLIYIYYLSIQI